MGKPLIFHPQRGKGSVIYCIECGTAVSQMENMKIMTSGTSRQGDVVVFDGTLNTITSTSVRVDLFPGESVFIVFEDPTTLEEDNSLHVNCLKCNKFLGWLHNNWYFILKNSIL